MAAPTRTGTNVLVGYANMYTAVTGTALPADTVAFNTDWEASVPAWNFAGFSDDGLSFTVDRKEKKHYVEEQSTPVKITVDQTTFSVSFVFAEATLENLKLATGGGTITTTAAASGQIGKKELVLSEDLDELALGFEAENEYGFFRRVLIPRVISIGKIKAQFDRSKNKTVYAATFESISPISDVVIKDKTANASA